MELEESSETLVKGYQPTRSTSHKNVIRNFRYMDDIFLNFTKSDKHMSIILDKKVKTVKFTL
jgi:hypothetical protein